MKERPILFSGEMVRAILDGRKTQTRRVVLKSGVDADYDCLGIENGRAIFHANRPAKRKELLMPSFGVNCPYGQPGDRLWVKETFKLWDHDFESVEVEYAANEGAQGKVVTFAEGAKPSANSIHARRIDGAKPRKTPIFMPRWASRITLEIVSVRVERLRDIGEEDAKAEGAPMYFVSYRLGFESLWDSINRKKHPWPSNPFCWRIEFKRI